MMLFYTKVGEYHANWLAVCYIPFMIVELNASKEEVKALIEFLDSIERFENIRQQLEVGLANGDDSQTGEIPCDGDNDIIERME
jgi:glutaredoxin-related protein